jgi:4-hydroxy-tetrahydrodipicolinate synthase
MMIHSASTFVISITPFTETGRLDEEAYRGHLRRMAAGGVGVYVGGGGSGEGYTLDAAETRRILEIAVEELQGKVPVRGMGVEPRMASEMIEYIRMASSLGVDACQVYSLDQGHGHRPTDAEVEAYFTEILDAVDTPCVISTHMSVGYQVRVPFLRELVVRYPHVIGINSSHQDHGYLARIIDAVGDRVTVHVGGPAQGLLCLSLGGQGFLTSEANLAPALCAAVPAAYAAGDLSTMMDAFGKVVRLSAVLYRHGGIRATKAVLNHLGLPGGFPRRPQLPVSEAVLATVMETVNGLDLASSEGWS